MSQYSGQQISFKKQRPHKNKRKTIDQARLEYLAIPTNRSPYFMPDRPSIYWLDFILDETHLKITNPVELMNYYDSFFSKSPRLKDLSRPKTVIEECPVTRPTTAYGVPLSALSYEPSERIKQLSTPKFRLKTAPPASSSVSAIFEGRRSSTASKVRIGDARSASSLQSSKRVRSASGTRPDLGHGDFYRRSQYRLQDRSSSRESGAPPISMRTRRPPMSPTKEKASSRRISEGIPSRRTRQRGGKGAPSTPSKSPVNKPKEAKSAPNVQSNSSSRTPFSSRPPVPSSPTRLLPERALPNSTPSSSLDIRGTSRSVHGKPPPPSSSKGSTNISINRSEGTSSNNNNSDNNSVASNSSTNSSQAKNNDGSKNATTPIVIRKSDHIELTIRPRGTNTANVAASASASSTRNSTRDNNRSRPIRKRPPFK